MDSSYHEDASVLFPIHLQPVTYIFLWQLKAASPGGFEPPTFRLTAERANQLRHGDMIIAPFQFIRFSIGELKAFYLLNYDIIIVYLLPLSFSKSQHNSIIYKHFQRS